MKIIFAIINNEDINKIIDILNSKEHSVTKLCSTGGFLRSGNSTLVIGIDDNEVESVIEILRDNSKKRTKSVQLPNPAGTVSPPLTKKINVGGATIFVVSVDQYKKV